MDVPSWQLGLTLLGDTFLSMSVFVRKLIMLERDMLDPFQSCGLA